MPDYDVLVTTALPRSLAAVHRSVRAGAVAGIIREALGEVWQFLREHKIRSTGHNVAIYAPASSGEPLLDVWFGVVARWQTCYLNFKLLSVDL